MGSRESEAIRALFPTLAAPEMRSRGLGSHYLVVEPRFELLVDGAYRTPEINQPTPDGLRLLVAAHQKKNEVDLRVHEKQPQTEDLVAARVIEFMKSADISELGENHPIGVILSHRQKHAIPIFLAVYAGKKYLVVLDSTSGAYEKQYWEVAQRFPEFQVRLNQGTRQADNQSCITDAFEILKQCYTVGALMRRIDERRAEEPSRANPKSRISTSGVQCPSNFSLFKLPEELAFVVQRATHLEESNLQMDQPVTVEGRTCPLSTHVVISTDFGRKHSEDAGDGERIRANIYLYQASWRHRETIETELDSEHGLG